MPPIIKPSMLKELMQPGVLKKTLLLFFPLMLILISMAVYIYSNEQEIHLKDLENTADKIIIDKQQCLSRQTETILRDLRLLSSIPAAQALLSKPSASTQRELAKLIIAFSNAKDLYHTICYLDHEQKIVLQVTFDPALGAYASTQHNDATGSGYSGTDLPMQLKGSDITISPFQHLSLDTNCTESDPVPVLRFTKPVRDENGKIIGTILLSYLGKPLVERFADHNVNQVDTLILLVNPDGYYLSGEPNGMNWGFLYPGSEKAVNFSQSYPAEWEKIRREQQGKFTSGNGFFTFKRISPILNSQSTGPNQLFWFIIAHVPSHKLTPILPLAAMYGIFSLIGSISLFIGTAAITTRNERSRKSHMHLEQLTAQLQEKTKILETVTDSVPACIYMKNANLRYTFSNRYTLEKFKKRFEEIMGKSDTDIFPAETAEKLLEKERKIIETGKPLINIQEDIRLSDGTVISVLSNKIPLTDEYGDIEGLLCVTMDRSEQIRAERLNKMLEEKLRESKKLETLGTLSGGIAHDFNNILTPIIGFTEITLTSQEPGSQTSKDLQTVLKAAQRAKKLVQQMLAFSRKEPMDLKVQPIQPIILESLDFMEHSIPSNITKDFYIEQFPEKVHCDAPQLQQVVLNLAANALQAMEGNDGTLKIRLEKALPSILTVTRHKELVPDVEYMQLTIGDTGSGIAKTELDRIFDPFYTTKTVGKGTGLGLSVVYGIVQSHHGCIIAESQLGKGTKMTVYLPLSDQETAQTSKNT